MHEISLVQSLLKTVIESAAANSISSVHRIRLVVGEMHGALPDALQFAFEVLSGGTVCAGAMLEVEKRPLVLRCSPCGQEFGPEGISRRCPACGGSSVVLVSGDEMCVDCYEGD
ncbi:MAG: hydrogenase maturation nickel metallochaperone HypA [Bacillota bacterium]